MVDWDKKRRKIQKASQATTKTSKVSSILTLNFCTWQEQVWSNWRNICDISGFDFCKRQLAGNTPCVIMINFNSFQIWRISSIKFEVFVPSAVALGSYLISFNIPTEPYGSLKVFLLGTVLKLIKSAWTKKHEQHNHNPKLNHLLIKCRFEQKISYMAWHDNTWCRKKICSTLVIVS